MHKIILAAPIISALVSYEQVEVKKFITQVLPTILEHTNTYDFNVTTLNTYGCWCAKFHYGRSVFGGRHEDVFDEICKNWIKNRHCLVLDGGTCQTVGFDSYNATLINNDGNVGLT